MTTYQQAKRVADNLRLSNNLDAVDSSRAWQLWDYLEKRAPWVCDACDGEGGMRHDEGVWTMCSRCNGTGDLMPAPIEPEEVIS